MSGDLEAGGAFVTAGLVASEIDQTKGAKSSRDHHAAYCANCGATLKGRYCQSCGQAAHLHRSLWHIAEETLHGIFHFDTKSWRTLPLLIGRPGLLTRRYIDGQRVRYVSPLALFLFMIFLMFFVVSLVGKDMNLNFGNEKDRDQIRTDLTTALSDAKKSIVEKEAELKDASDKDREEVTADLKELKVTQNVAEQALAAFDAAVPKEGSKGSADSHEKKKHGFNVNFDDGNSKLAEVINHNLNNPDLLLYKLKNTAYKYSFMLIPISLPFLWLMFFWRRDIHLYEHAIFSLYSLSFMSLFFVVVALMTTQSTLKEHIGALFLVPPIHMFAQLRGTYRLGIFSALWRTLALICICGTVFGLFMAMIVTISVV